MGNSIYSIIPLNQLNLIKMVRTIESKHDIGHLKNTDIDPVCALVIEMILIHTLEVKDLEEGIIKEVTSREKYGYRNLAENATILSHLRSRDITKQLKDRLWTECTPNVALKIAKGETFALKSWREGEELLIPKSMLPNLAYYDKVSKSDPKAEAARILGATLI